MTLEPNDPTASGPSFPDAGAAVVLSRNEIESLCAKAARGAGISWGDAEEAGFAAGWLHAHGLDGSSVLLTHLETGAANRPIVGQGHWRPAGAGPLCPIATGATLSDYCTLPEGALGGGGLTVEAVASPVLLLPFLSRNATRLGHGIAVSFPGGAVIVEGAGAIAGDLGLLVAQGTATLLMKPCTSAAAAPHRAPAGCVGTVLARLNRLAMQTTVPPSDRSRGDAGSGTDDND
ncbi:DUF3726 domain-containing protein [Defluviimonas sp. WL0075]|uniref:DUF3726 domain-containing protein n=1 Tax=Albidovulum sediminicola TaxID=2984331 RepID=A0ABT2YY09_9RHOB|nr:DUF3726 domain-containing protein [Defluviimonas sp. WL0075]MCV2863754.1 DUF3726 domain-containing protein [Defluviimonas sp. WL0075]